MNDFIKLQSMLKKTANQQKDLETSNHTTKVKNVNKQSPSVPGAETESIVFLVSHNPQSKDPAARTVISERTHTNLHEGTRANI